MFSDTSLLILAGGESKRMGVPKHLLTVQGENILDSIVNRLGELFDEVLVAGRNIRIERPDIRVLEDILPERTPLVGMLTGALVSRNRNMFVMGCDMPFVNPSLIRLILSRKTELDDIAVPFVNGFHEPLCAVYSCGVSTVLKEYIESGGRKITGFFQLLHVRRVMEDEISQVDPNYESFINLNTPADFSKYNLV